MAEERDPQAESAHAGPAAEEILREGNVVFGAEPATDALTIIRHPEIDSHDAVHHLEPVRRLELC